MGIRSKENSRTSFYPCLHKSASLKNITNESQSNSHIYSLFRRTIRKCTGNLISPRNPAQNGRNFITITTATRAEIYLRRRQSSPLACLLTSVSDFCYFPHICAEDYRPTMDTWAAVNRPGFGGKHTAREKSGVQKYVSGGIASHGWNVPPLLTEGSSLYLGYHDPKLEVPERMLEGRGEIEVFAFLIKIVYTTGIGHIQFVKKMVENEALFTTKYFTMLILFFTDIYFHYKRPKLATALKI